MVEPLVPGYAWRLPLRGVSAYLVDDGSVTLVDAGGPWDRRRLRGHLISAGYGFEDLDRVLVTHFDLDHVAALADLPSDLPVSMPEPDAGYLQGRRSPPLFDRKGAFQRLTRPFVPRPSGSIEPVADGESIDGFTAYRTPGHTPGHTAYVHEGLDVAFLGDLVMESGGRFREPPRVLSADPGLNRRSIVAFADRTPPFEATAVGHGDPIPSGGREALRALAARLRGSR